MIIRLQYVKATYCTNFFSIFFLWGGSGEGDIIILTPKISELPVGYHHGAELQIE